MQYVRISHLLNSYSKEIRAQHITRETTNCCCCYIVSWVSHVVSSPGLDLIRYEVIGSCINLSMNVHKKSVSVIIRHKISSPSYPPFCCMNPCTCSSQRWSVFAAACVCLCPDLHALCGFLLSTFSQKGPSKFDLFLKLTYSCSIFISILFHLPVFCPQEKEEADTKLVLRMIIYLLQ